MRGADKHLYTNIFITLLRTLKMQATKIIKTGRAIYIVIQSYNEFMQSKKIKPKFQRSKKNYENSKIKLAKNQKCITLFFRLALNITPKRELLSKAFSTRDLFTMGLKLTMSSSYRSQKYTTSKHRHNFINIFINIE